jgi:ribosome-associated toxin RatA of RatAB toxin-antitoxin module
MLRTHAAIQLGVAFAVLLGMLSSSAFGQQDPAALARSLGNEVRSEREATSDSDIDWGNAVGVVNAPFERVSSAVRNYANYHRFLPFFTQSRIVSARGSRALVYMEASVLHGSVTLWANMRMGTRPSRGDTQIIAGRMADGNMGDFRARWELTPLDEGRRTLVRLKVLIDPDLPLPDSICSSENVSSARRTIIALRRFLGVSAPSGS